MHTFGEKEIWRKTMEKREDRAGEIGERSGAESILYMASAFGEPR